MGQGLSQLPKHFTVKQMVASFPDADKLKMYPDQEFLKEHYEIIQPYRKLIDFYKGTSYRTVNSFYKTGHSYPVPSDVRDNIKELFGLATAPTGKQFWIYFIKAMDDLYAKVKPLDHDIVVYRGVRNGTVGQNFFDGDCIVSVKYPKGQSHRYCKPEEMLDFKFFSDFKDQDIREYVYETLGFVSTSTRFHTALNFGCSGAFSQCDTIFAMRLPAGTKFIMPLIKTVDAKGKEQYSDYEYEFILFPLHNTFIIDQAGVVNYKVVTAGVNYIINLYYGSYCNALNMYRPPNMPKQRELQKLPTTVKKVPIDVKALNQNPGGKCDKYKIEDCADQNKICNPKTGKCLQPTAANIKKVGLTKPKKSAKKKAAVTGKTIGKCTASKREQCKKSGKICNPKTGQCLKSTAANQTKAAAAAQGFGIKTTTEFTKYFL